MIFITRGMIFITRGMIFIDFGPGRDGSGVCYGVGRLLRGRVSVA